MIFFYKRNDVSYAFLDVDFWESRIQFLDLQFFTLTVFCIEGDEAKIQIPPINVSIILWDLGTVIPCGSVDDPI